MSDKMPAGMPDKVPECLPDRTPEDLPDRMSDRMSEDMPEDMPDRVPEDMPEHIAEDMPGRMPEDMPDRMPEDMPYKIPEDMSDRMPEDLPVAKRIDVMVGISLGTPVAALTALCGRRMEFWFLVGAVSSDAVADHTCRVDETSTRFGEDMFLKDRLNCQNGVQILYTPRRPQNLTTLRSSFHRRPTCFAMVPP